jgi:hypothetical protein
MAHILKVALASLVLASAAGLAGAKDAGPARNPWWMQTLAGDKSSPVTQGLRVPAPGYINIDGRWYVFSGANFGSTLLALPLGTGNGYAVSGWVSPRNCRVEPASPTPPSSTSRFLVQEGTTPILDMRLWGPGNEPGATAQIRLSSCLNTPVIAVTSNSGRLLCDGQIAAPFTESQCPVLGSLLRPTPTVIRPMFRNGFEAL